MKRSGAPRRLQLVRTLLGLIFIISSSAALHAQSSPEPASPEVVQARIERSRALIAAHQLETAASELESVRGASQDYSVRNIASVMLMSIYLESGNYGRAEALLEEAFRARPAQTNDSVYFALAGQAVNGARAHVGRYRSFGISIIDANLPVEAANDLNRLRSLLERMIAQAKEISNERKAYDSLSLLEDVLGLRLSLAKDSNDQAKWDSEYASAREVQASSQTQIASLGGIPSLPTKAASPMNSVANSKPAREATASDKTPPAADKQPVGDQPATDPASATAPKVDPAKLATETKSDSIDKAKTISSGLLNAKATKKVLPRYPALAKQTGATGVVRVYVLVDESGKVVEVSRSEGPPMLRQAAEDAARRWSFSPVNGDAGPIRFSGYIDFNFTL